MSGNPSPGGDWLAGLLATAAPRAALNLPGAEAVSATLADDLRRRLALRGRTPPGRLLPDELSTAERQAVLSAVLPDCDSGPSNEGWLLRDAPRRAVLGGLRSDGLRTLLATDPAPADSIWQALNVLGTKAAQSVETLPSDVLRGLLQTLGALGSAYAEASPIQVDAVRWQLARKTRRDGYARLGNGFVGRRWERWHLRTFLEQPIPDERSSRSPSVQALVLHGAGGAGKSALLGVVLGPMLDRQPDLALVHLDFDRPALDPLVPTSLDIELLRQIGQVDQDTDKRMHRVRAAIRAALQEAPSRRGLSEEAAGSDGLAAFDGSLEWLKGVRRPLLLVLDTVEQVQAAGPARMRALLDWIGRVAAGSGAPELRVVLAGRDDPTPWLTQGSGIVHPRRRALAVAAGGADPDDRARTRRLSDLQPADAEALLQSRGVPAKDSPRLVRTFGGNPLILRLVADLAVRGDPLDAPAGQLPAGLVQGYLYDRILKHIGEEARPFAHPGLVLPALTPQMIAEVLGPVKNEPDMKPARAQSIFDALVRPGWLTQRSGDAVRLRPDLRRLTLQLIASDPARRQEMQDVHRAAQLWHARQRGTEHEGMALYHGLMLDSSSMPDTLPSVVAQVLLPLLDDLPEAARAKLRARSDLGLGLGEDVAAAQLSNEDWADYLSEDGGAGAKLASSRAPDEVLQLWRSRPSGRTGEPPTPVLQALAEAGEWEGDEADVRKIGHRLLIGTDRGQAQRLYWACCLALLQPPHKFPPILSEALRLALLPEHERALWRPAETIRLAALASLLGHFEMSSLRREPGTPVEPRVAQALLSRATPLRPAVLTVALDGLVVLQADWEDRAQEAIGVVLTSLPSGSLHAVQSEIRQLDGGRLGNVAPMLRLFSETRVHLEMSDGPAANSGRALLLRDVTPELHRPAREALRQALPSTDRARTVLDRFRPLLSICPSELEPESLLARIARDPAGWWLQVVQFADQARVLGSLLDLAIEASPHVPRLTRVAATFHAWDAALGIGVPSAWTKQGRSASAA